MSEELARTVQDSATDSLFDNLVTQFADALDCFRELVQNAIDAGSPRVDVWAEYEASDGHTGTIALHVDDFGEGMDEYIIDDQFTRLFSSAKEDDLTKIGKFGIGFVSVFALNPEAIVVHTGRAGEYWEVFFHPDRSFTKTRLDVPVEGTQITLFLKGDATRYNQLVIGIPVTLKRWCGHSDTEITFEDRTPTHGGVSEPRVINEPFEVDGKCASVFEMRDGTKVAMAFNTLPSYGFYNRGLTIAQTNVGSNVFSTERSAALAQIALKINSRYLEHTLSRDTVMRDRNYFQAMKHIDEAQVGLHTKLLDNLEALATTAEWTLDNMHEYAALLSFLALEKSLDPEQVFERAIFRDLHRSAAYTPDDLWKVRRRDGRILIAEAGTKLTTTLSNMGIPIVTGRVGGVSMWGDEIALSHPLDGVSLLMTRFVALRDKSTFFGAVKAWFRDPSKLVAASLSSPELAYIPVKVEANIDPEYEGLLRGAQRCLDGARCRYKRLAVFEPLGVDAPFFVLGRELADVMARPTELAEHARIEVAVNKQHAHFLRLVETHKSQPGFAEYCLAKALLLQEDRGLSRDVELMKFAQERG